MKVLLLDNYDSFTYNLAQIVEESGLCSLQIVKTDTVNISKVQNYEKILISPGAGLPRESKKISEIIRFFYKTKSILGICLGHQAIAEVFGGQIYNLKKVYHGVKNEITILDNTDVLFDKIPPKIEVGLYHSWAVDIKTIPTCFQITAISEDNILMGFRHKQHNLFGIQFHPESIMTPYGKDIIENWLIQSK